LQNEIASEGSLNIDRGRERFSTLMSIVKAMVVYLNKKSRIHDALDSYKEFVLNYTRDDIRGKVFVCCGVFGYQNAHM
jgi:hypothetical protein